MVEPVDPARLSADVRAMLRALSRRLRVTSEPVAEVPLHQHDVLVRLAATPGMTSAELARAQQVRPQSMGTTIAALRDEGLIEARAAEDDGRRRLLYLTEAGMDLLARIGAVRDDWLSHQLVGSLDDDELRTVRDAVRLLQSIADREG